MRIKNFGSIWGLLYPPRRRVLRTMSGGRSAAVNRSGLSLDPPPFEDGSTKSRRIGNAFCILVRWDVDDEVWLLWWCPWSMAARQAPSFALFKLKRAFFLGRLVISNPLLLHPTPYYSILHHSKSPRPWSRCTSSITDAHVSRITCYQTVTAPRLDVSTARRHEVR